MIQKQQNTVRQAAQWLSEPQSLQCHHMVGAKELALTQLNFAFGLNMIKYGYIMVNNVKYA